MTHPARHADIPDGMQLQLVETPTAAKLRPRQQAAYDAIQAAGIDGLYTDEVGATVHAWAGKHLADERCRWCGAAGQEVGRALRSRHGLVKQRRRRTPGGGQESVWVTVDARAASPVVEEPEAWDGSGPVPYGVIPY